MDQETSHMAWMKWAIKGSSWPHETPEFSFLVVVGQRYLKVIAR